MSRIRPWLRVIVALCFGFALLHGGRAWGANFEVSPIRVPLSRETPNGMLTVKNQSAEPLRFQVTAFAWAQGPGGEMQLAPTDDLVVFPTVFTLKPGESRHMRVGTLAPPSGGEKTYRVFVEELPPLRAPAVPNAIRVLTRMGIPVFVSPPGSAPTPRVEGLDVLNGQIVFALHNAGSGFFLAHKVELRGLDKDGRAVFTRALPAWYVLAGGVRAYALDVPDEACKAARLEVAVETEAGTTRASAEMLPRACAR
jgi:fimbrial chaperone protein